MNDSTVLHKSGNKVFIAWTLPPLSYFFLVLCSLAPRNLKRSLNVFWRQVLGLGLEGQVLGLGLEAQVLGLGLGLEAHVLVNNTAWKVKDATRIHLRLNISKTVQDSLLLSVEITWCESNDHVTDDITRTWKVKVAPQYWRINILKTNHFYSQSDQTGSTTSPWSWCSSTALSTLSSTPQSTESSSKEWDVWSRKWEVNISPKFPPSFGAK